ncbi:hypothetical protein [Nocardioides sp. SYSU DS0651]|uniref:hypothetical protein n=1 Tax=Nocardioides sp. SYSU DS0651 TaxID=3415955 RepID=UPI003F4AF891
MSQDDAQPTVDGNADAADAAGGSPDDRAGNGTDDGRTAEREDERREIAEGQEVLDAQADGEGLAAEAGAGEETGLAEG